MLIQLHSQASTTPKIQAAIQASDEPVSMARGDSFQHIRRAVAILNTRAVDLETNEQSEVVSREVL